MAYLLDADVFIRAKNLHYGLDFCPAFWDWLTQLRPSLTEFGGRRENFSMVSRVGRGFTLNSD